VGRARGARPRSRGARTPRQRARGARAQPAVERGKARAHDRLTREQVPAPRERAEPDVFAGRVGSTWGGIRDTGSPRCSSRSPYPAFAPPGPARNASSSSGDGASTRPSAGSHAA
jgi:hypothetical protein